MAMKSANSLVIALLLLLHSPSLGLLDVQPIYVSQLTPNANQKPQSFTISSLTPAPSKPLEIAPTPFNPAPFNPEPVNPAPVNPALVNPEPVNQVVNQPLDEFLQVPQQVPNQQCYLRQCDQIISGRNLLYSRALEIVQNEEYLTEADLDLIRRRYKRQSTDQMPSIPVISPIFEDLPTASESVQDDNLLPTLVSIGVGIGTVAVAALYAIPDIPLTLEGSGVPPGNPEPGTPGGGGAPNTLPEAVALVPVGLNAIAVFPPYNTPRTVPAISVIFAENPAIGNFSMILNSTINEFFSGPDDNIRKKRSENGYFHGKMAQFIKNFRCLKARLRYRSTKKNVPHAYHYGKREVVNSLDDCFDFIGEPLYGFRTLISTEKFCFGNDFNCLQSSSIGIQARQTEEFESEAPADCRLTLSQNNNCV